MVWMNLNTLIKVLTNRLTRTKNISVQTFCHFFFSFLLHKQYPVGWSVAAAAAAGAGLRPRIPPVRSHPAAHPSPRTAAVSALWLSWRLILNSASRGPPLPLTDTRLSIVQRHINSLEIVLLVSNFAFLISLFIRPFLFENIDRSSLIYR